MMKILWFPRLQFDIDKLHITTWREMRKELEAGAHRVKIAIAGNDVSGTFDRYIRIPIIRRKFLRIITFLFNGYFKFIWNYIRLKPDCVILDLYSIWFSIPLAVLFKKKTVFIVDNRTPFYNSAPRDAGFKDKIMRWYTGLCYGYCRVYLAGMTVITENYKKQVCRDYNFDYDRVGVWGSGVDLERFRIDEYERKNKEFFPGKFILIQHGEISLNRGLLETVEALHLLNKTDIVFVMIGDVAGGSSAKSMLLQKISRFHLEDKVYILPAVPYADIPRYLKYCDCAVMAYPNIEYWNNNNPIKLIEYMAMGKMVLCTDMWTFRDVAGNRKFVRYIADNKPASIAAGIDYCYQNRMYLDQWGREGLETVKERFTWGRQADNLLRFITQLKNNEGYSGE